MLRLAADETFNGDIVRGLLRRNPKLDIVRVQVSAWEITTKARLGKLPRATDVAADVAACVATLR